MPRQVEPRHHRMIGVADEETAALRGQLPDRDRVRARSARSRCNNPPARALGLGVKIIVAVCSTMADAIRLSSASRADCVAKPTMRVPLPERLQPIADAGGEHGVVERFPALVDQDHRRARRPAAPRRGGTGTSSPGCAGCGIVEQRGHVEADRARGEIELGPTALSNSQACSPLHRSTAPGERPRSPTSGRRRAAEQLAEVAQAGGRRGPPPSHASTADGDRPPAPPAPFALKDHAQPVTQEGAVDRMYRAIAERVETGRLARQQAAIGSRRTRAGRFPRRDPCRTGWCAARNAAPARRGS